MAARAWARIERPAGENDFKIGHLFTGKPINALGQYVRS